MKGALFVAVTLCLVAPVLALDGQPGLHDPSTIVVDHGKF